MAHDAMNESKTGETSAAHPEQPPPEERAEGAPKWLYLHGFASGPASAKGLSIAAHYNRFGIDVQRLDMRLPSFENMRISAMIDGVRAAIGGESDRAILFGSS